MRVCDREQLQLDRGDDAEAAAAAAQRPEQVGLVLAVGAHELAVGGHQLDRVHMVGGQAVLTAEKAHPTAERVADYADVGRGARQRGEPVPGRGLDDLEPDRSRLDAGGPAGRFDRDSAHPLGLDEDRVVERVERTCIVARSLRGDP
jgi:hypothetical protein